MRGQRKNHLPPSGLSSRERTNTLCYFPKEQKETIYPKKQNAEVREKQDTEGWVHKEQNKQRVTRNVFCALKKSEKQTDNKDKNSCKLKEKNKVNVNAI